MKRLFAIILFFLFTAPAYGAVYHIDPSCGTPGDGTSGVCDGSATDPFDEWTDLPSMATSDDVYFKCATTYAPSAQMNITWGGTSGNRAVVGAYYVTGGSEVYGVSGANPIITGSSFTIPNATADAAWGGLLRVDTRTVKKDYITIQNLNIKECGGHCLEIIGAWTTETTPQYIIIEDSYLGPASRNSLLIQRTHSLNGIIRNNDISGGAYGWKYLSFPSPWAGTFSFAHNKFSSTDIYGNYVHHGWGEGIGIWTSGTEDSGYARVYNNTVFSSRRISIYIDGTSGSEIFNNVMIGTDDCVYKGVTTLRPDGGCWNQAGFALNAESYYNRHSSYTTENPVYEVMDVEDNKVYNNLIIGHLTGLEIGVGAQAYPGEDRHTNNEIFNNTFIANRYNMRVDAGLADLVTANNEMKDNVFACVDYAAPDGCENQGGMVASFDTYYDVDYNMWAAPIPTNGDGPNDLIAPIDGWDLTSLPIHDIQEGQLDEVVQWARKLVGHPGVGSGSQDADQPSTDYFGLTRPSGAKDRGFDQYGGATQNRDPIISAMTPIEQCIAQADLGNLDDTFICTATDPDSDSLSYEWTVDGGSVISTGTTITGIDEVHGDWTNGNSYDVKCEVSDGKGGTADRTNRIDVSASCGGSIPTTATVGMNTSDNVNNTVDAYIRAQTADRDTAYNNNKLEIEDPFTDDTGQKVALISLDTSAWSGITATRARLCVYIQQAPDSTTDLDVYDSDDVFTEAATWTDYDGTNAWSESDSPEAGSILESHTVTSTTTGAICFDSDDTAGLLTHVNAHMGGVTPFVIGADTETSTDIELVSSEGTDGNRPYLEITYSTGGSTTLVSTAWGNPSSTLGEGATLYLVGTWDSPETLSNGATLTISTSATGAAIDLVATGDGNAYDQLTFVATVPASATTSGIGLTLTDGAGNDIVLAGGTFSGGLELPDAPNRASDNGEIIIDTGADAMQSTCNALPGASSCATADYTYKLGEKPRFIVTWPSAMSYSGGPVSDISLTVALDTGSSLVFKPIAGVGTTQWIFEAQAVEQNMTETDLRMSLVTDLSHTGVTIEDLAGNDASSTSFPNVDLDTSFKVGVDGTPRRYRAPGLGGGNLKQAEQY